MIIFMRGTSCSGKDTFIEKYFDGVCVLSSDDTRKLLFDDANNQRHSREVFKYMKDVLDSRLRHMAGTTVMNAMFLRIKDVRDYVELAKKYHTKCLVISIVPPDIDELKRRNNNRAPEIGRHVDETSLERQHARYFDAKQAFIEESTFNPYFNMIEIDQNYEVVNDYTTS